MYQVALTEKRPWTKECHVCDKKTPKNMFKEGNKKDTRTASVNVIRVSLYLAWNIPFKSLMKPVFSKTLGLYYKWE